MTDPIPLSDQAVAHLSPGCRCRWSFFDTTPATVGITGQDPDCKVHPKPKGAPVTDHVYVSTACQHRLHDKCRLNCKYCGKPCACPSPECIHDETGEVLFRIATTDPGDAT